MIIVRPSLGPFEWPMIYDLAVAHRCLSLLTLDHIADPELSDIAACHLDLVYHRQRHLLSGLLPVAVWSDIINEYRRQYRTLHACTRC